MTRIGTWNLNHQRKNSSLVLERQLAFMEIADCDLWLLTEVPYTFEDGVAAGSTRLSGAMDKSHKAWAAVWARDGVEEDLDPIHEAAAFARVNGQRVCSCVLPWRSMPFEQWADKDPDGDRENIMRIAVERLREGLADTPGDLVWGGDWNQALQGKDSVTTHAGRSALAGLIATLGLKAPTSVLAHTTDGGTCSIDHIAVPNTWNVVTSSRVVAKNAAGKRLSDHDAYVIEVDV